MRCRGIVVVLVASLAAAGLSAGEFNQTLSIGDKAPVWEGLPGSDGKPHSLADFKDKDAVVIVFTCLSCPTAVDYEDRINALAKKYAGSEGKVGLVAVCVNRVEADRLDKLTERANQKEFVFPVIYDESQKIAKDHGAIFTPEFYVVDRERKIAYMGAMDDSTDSDKVTKRFVEDAIVAVLKGEQPLVKETIARGCRVRYARERK